MDNYWKDKNILIIGASSDLCTHLLPEIMCMNKIGLHYNNNETSLTKYAERENVRLFQQKFHPGSNVKSLVDDFVSWAGGLDFLIIMVGNCLHPVYWEELTEEDMMDDYYINVAVPFLIAQQAIKHMKNMKGGVE